MKLAIPRVTIPKWLKTTIKLVISGIIITLILRKIDERLLLSVVREANPLWVLWALIWFAISKMISAFRFNSILGTEGIHLTTMQNLRLYWLCMYYNLLLPGGISGDGYKIKLLMDMYNRPFKRMLSITLMDRISGLVALGQLSLILLLYVPEFRAYWYFILPAFLLSFVVCWFVFQWMVGRHPRVWMTTLVQSLGVQGSQSIATLGLVFALGQGLHWPDYLVLFLVSSVVAMLPITIGGAGARELTFLYGSVFLDIHAEKAVAIGFLFYLISTSVSFMGIIFSFKKGKMDFKKINDPQTEGILPDK
jgi:uncharacterized membrane protein YbhN (UPF0104 family)